MSPATQAKAEPGPAGGPFTLAIDIGGTGLKASVLDHRGEMAAPRVHLPTPQPCPPPVLLAALAEMVGKLPAFHRVSAGFPGAVRGGIVLTAPNLGTEAWAGFPLESQLTERFGRPARVLNDAEVQGLGVIGGAGMEMILTLGTGAGIGIFFNGRVSPHIELSQHPVHKKLTYDQYLGKEALEKTGPRRWNKRLRMAIEILARVVLFDRLYIGGGNAAHIKGDLPANVTIVANEAGITGGIALWRDPV
jgi:polyphosphate glucokinase